jgi:protein TonB
MARWDSKQPLALKRAFALVNSGEIVIIGAIVLAVRLGTKVQPIEIPDPTEPVIRIIKGTDLMQPPPIDIERPLVTLPEALPAAVLNTGIPLPVQDTLATNPTMATQGQLGVLNQPLVKLDPSDPAVKLVIDTPAVPPVKDPETLAIPQPNERVRMSRKPDPVFLKPPEYPGHCRMLGIEGRTTVHLLLDRDGAVMKAQVFVSSGNHELDAAAVKAGAQCRFTPALGATGQPVRVWVAVPFSFKLDK